MQILALNRHNHMLRSAQTKRGNDLFLQRSVSRCRHCADSRTFRQLFDECADFLIGRTERIAPLNDAVRLIDHHKRWLTFFAQAKKSGIVEPFGCNEQNPGLAAGKALNARCAFLRSHQAIELNARNAFLLEMTHLIMHQDN